jgi:hypothetical protein
MSVQCGIKFVYLSFGGLIISCINYVSRTHPKVSLGGIGVLSTLIIQLVHVVLISKTHYFAQSQN